MQTPPKGLIDTARQRASLAYAPYSRFSVGAAVLTGEGTIFGGANVENVSSGLTICAERVAIASAVANGARLITALAVASPGGVTPCGACRQCLSEFSGGNSTPVWIIDLDEEGAVERLTLDELLPRAFRLERDVPPDTASP